MANSYSAYHELYETTKIADLKRNAELLDPSSTISVAGITINFLSNTVRNFNWLKNTTDIPTDSLTRAQYTMPRVQNAQLRNLGLLIDIYGNFTNATLLVKDNTVENIFSHLRDNKIHCDGLFDGQSIIPTQAVMVGEKDSLYQYSHLFSLANIEESTVIFYSNNIEKISIAGPLFNIEGKRNKTTQNIIVAKNIITNIHGYASTNIIQITRWFYAENYDPNMGPQGGGFIQLSTTSQNGFINFFRFGGGILIQENQFSEIIGCSNVDTSVLRIQVSTTEYSPDTKNTESYKRNLLLPNNQYMSDISKVAESLFFFLQTKIQNIYDLVMTQISYEGLSFTLKLYTTELIGNTYTNISMGVGEMVQTTSLPSKGSLHKFLNVLSLDIKNDVYKNIGAYTVEQLDLSIKEIRGEENEAVRGKPKYKMTDIDVTEGVYMTTHPFFLSEISHTMIFINGMVRLRILEACVFDNIWLIDRKQAMIKNTGDDTIADYGLLLYLRTFNGQLQIGGSTLRSKVTTSYLQLKNLVGHINDFTIQKYPDWHPKELNNDVDRDSKQFRIKFGSGSTIINTYAATNHFYDISFQYVNMSRLYNRIQVTKGTEQASIISTYVQEASPFFAMMNFAMSHCIIKDVTYEFGTNYFNLLGFDVVITNLTVERIGQRFNIFETYPEFLTLPGVAFNPIEGSFFSVPLVQEIGRVDAFNNNFTIINSKFSNITSQQAGIFNAYLVKDLANSAIVDQIKIYNCTFQYIQAIGTGYGAIFSETSSYFGTYNIVFYNSYFYYNYGYNGFFTFAKSITSLQFISCTFYENLGNEARAIQIKGNLAKYIYIKDCIFLGETRSPADIQEQLYYHNVPFNNASQIVVDSLDFSSQVVIDNATALYLNYALAGSFMSVTLFSQDVKVLNSYFYGCSATFGGIIYITQASKVYITNSTFDSNAAENSAAFAVNDLSTFVAENITVINCYANQQGIFRFSSGSNFKIQSSLFYKNVARRRVSMGQMIDINVGTFIDCTFQKNQVISSDIAVSEGQLGIEIVACKGNIQFQSCDFLDNTANFVTAGIYMNNSPNILFDGCLFKNSRFTTSITPDLMFGGFMHLVAGSKATIKNSDLINGLAEQGGAIYLLGQTTLIIENSAFRENRALTKGGAISATSFTKLELTNNTKFYDSIADDGNGDVLYALNCEDYILVNSSYFFKLEPSHFFAIGDASEVIIDNSRFEAKDWATQKMKGNKVLYSGVTLDNVMNITIRGSQFTNLKSTSTAYPGGALNIFDSLNFKSDFNHRSINNTKFISCQGLDGGAIALFDVAKMRILGNTQFINNKATKTGGAIHFFCDDYGSDKTQCSLEIDNVTFTGNQAGIEGGAIKWNFYEPIMSNFEFKNNAAGVYGDNIASIAQRVAKVERKQSRMRVLSESESNKVAGVQSGGAFDMQFAVVDKYGTVITTDNKSKLFISAVQQTQKGTSSDSFTSSIESQTSVNCVNGTFEIKNFVFVGQPNSTRSIKISTDAVNYNIPSNDEYRTNLLKQLAANKSVKISDNILDSISLEDAQSVQIDLVIRNCLPGEELLSSGKCRKCDHGKYLLAPSADLKPQACKDCPPSEKAECDGGSDIYPRPGYWRSSNFSDNFIQCRNDVACLGRNGEENNTLGACNDGYQGILCCDCQVGYSRTGSSYQCSRCPNNVDNGFRLTALFITMLIGIVILVRSSLQGALEKKNFLSVFIRILMNHFQLLTLTASFDLDWPEKLKVFFTSTKPVSEITTQFLSVDCFIDSRHSANSTTYIKIRSHSFEEEDDDATVIRIFFVKVLMFALSPLLVMAASWFVWNLIFLFRRIKLFRRGSESKISVHPVQQLDPSGVDVSAIGGQPSTTNMTMVGTPMIQRQESAPSEGAPMSSLPNIQGNIPTQANDQQMQQMEAQLLAQEYEKQMKTGRIISTIIIVLFMVHPTITTVMFNAFNCQDIDGESRLYEDLEIRCNHGQHRLWSLSVALPALIVWGIGIPTIALIMLFQRRQELTLLETKTKFGFLYNGYRVPKAYYWELVIMYRKILVIFIQVFLAQLGKIVQALSMLIFLICCLTATSIMHPFANHQLNSLEALSLLSSAITVYCGLFYIANANFKPDQKFSLTESGEMFLFSIILLSQISFLLYWAANFLSEIKSTIRKKAPKLYLTLFLCCQEKVFEQEKRTEAQQEKMAPFLNLIDHLADYLHERKQMYIGGNVPIEDEALKKLLIQCNHFIHKVEHTVKYSHDHEKSLGLDQLLREKNNDQKIYKLRPHLHQKSKLQKKLMGADKLLQLDMGSMLGPPGGQQLDKELEEKLEESDDDYLRSQIGFEEDDQDGDGNIPIKLSSQRSKKNYQKMQKSKSNNIVPPTSGRRAKGLAMATFGRRGHQMTGGNYQQIDEFLGSQQNYEEESIRKGNNQGSPSMKQLILRETIDPLDMDSQEGVMNLQRNQTNDGGGNLNIIEVDDYSPDLKKSRYKRGKHNNRRLPSQKNGFGIEPQIVNGMIPVYRTPDNAAGMATVNNSQNYPLQLFQPVEEYKRQSKGRAGYDKQIDSLLMTSNQTAGNYNHALASSPSAPNTFREAAQQRFYHNHHQSMPMIEDSMLDAVHEEEKSPRTDQSRAANTRRVPEPLTLSQEYRQHRDLLAENGVQVLMRFSVANNQSSKYQKLKEQRQRTLLEKMQKGSIKMNRKRTRQLQLEQQAKAEDNRALKSLDMQDMEGAVQVEEIGEEEVEHTETQPISRHLRRARGLSISLESPRRKKSDDSGQQENLMSQQQMREEAMRLDIENEMMEIERSMQSLQVEKYLENNQTKLQNE